MTRFARPVFFGLLAFIAWIGIVYIVSAGVLKNASLQTHEDVGGVLALLFLVGSLVCGGAVAAWFAPRVWLESSTILGVICALLLAWFGSFEVDNWLGALVFLLGIGISVSGAAAVHFFLKWLRD